MELGGAEERGQEPVAGKSGGSSHVPRSHGLAAHLPGRLQEANDTQHFVFNLKVICFSLPPF